MLGRIGLFLLAAVLGVLQAASVADPLAGHPRWWLQVASLAGLAWLVRRSAGHAWRGAALGWVFAIAWLAGTFWWLFISMHVYGGLAAPLAVAAVLALAAFLGLYYALAAGLAARWKAGPLAFAALWLGAELMRASWFTGFPWGAGGYAHVDGPLAALAPWVGVYGIGFMAALFAGAIASLPRPAGASLGPASVALVLVAAALFAGDPSPASPGPRAQVALLQGNIPQDEKFQGGTGIPIALEWYGLRLQDAPAPLVVAPETAIPVLPQQLPADYWQGLQRAFATGERAALVGVPLGDLSQGYTNSVIGLQGGAAPYRYDKHHLVPFGEFIPPFFRWFTDLMNIPLGDFNRGAVGQASFEWRGQRLAPNICYEDLFGEELAARFIDPARAPTAFVNVSNIAWFGDTVAIDQHLHISRMRALEFRRPMLRATNTGATVIIDREGRVTHALPRLTRGVLVGEFEGGTGITPFAAWASRFGLWPLWVLVAVGVLSAARRARG